MDQSSESTNGNEDSDTRCRKGGKAGPTATVKFGSASVPIYLTESKGRKRYFIAHYRDGKRIRKAFPDLAAAKKEALFVAQRIQSGMQHVTDLKPHERDHYAKAVELRATRLPLMAATRLRRESPSPQAGQKGMTGRSLASGDDGGFRAKRTPEWGSDDTQTADR